MSNHNIIYMYSGHSIITQDGFRSQSVFKVATFLSTVH